MLKTRRFGWPIKLKKEGFLDSKTRLKNLDRIILRVLKSKKNDWFKIAVYIQKNLFHMIE